MLRKKVPHPSKKLGQNFLADKKVLQRIVEAADLKDEDVVLEIGPGTGVLTRAMAPKVKKIIAIEKDPRMITVLKEELSGFKNVEVLRGDIRRLNLQLPPRYKVVGNLPFYLTAPIIRKFLEVKEVRPLSLTLVVQKEMGQRICSKPPEMSLLAVSVQVYADVEKLFYVSKKSFWPQPKVDAAVIKIIPRPPLIGDNEKFFKIVKAGFSQPRKQLINNLSKGLKIAKEKTAEWLEKNNLWPAQRAETLSVDDWVHLTKTFVV